MNFSRAEPARGIRIIVHNLAPARRSQQCRIGRFGHSVDFIQAVIKEAGPWLLSSAQGRFLSRRRSGGGDFAQDRYLDVLGSNLNAALDIGRTTLHDVAKGLSRPKTISRASIRATRKWGRTAISANGTFRFSTITITSSGRRSASQARPHRTIRSSRASRFSFSRWHSLHLLRNRTVIRRSRRVRADLFTELAGELESRGSVSAGSDVRPASSAKVGTG